MEAFDINSTMYEPGNKVLGYIDKHFAGGAKKTRGSKRKHTLARRKSHRRRTNRKIYKNKRRVVSNRKRISKKDRYRKKKGCEMTLSAFFSWG